MDKVKKIVAKVFKIDESKIKMNLSPDNVESWDSFNQLLLINELEKEFKVVLDFEEIFKIMSVGDIYKILKKKNVI